MKLKKNYTIYIIAGEPSGDFIGSKLIHSLKLKSPNINIIGIGGYLMEQQGLKSLFNIKKISIMGFLEVVPRLFSILKLIKLTVNDIKQKQPDILITIDSPGFNLHVAKAIKKIFNNKIKLIHYVAPSVWAYKEKRTKKFSKIFDYLYCLLPFEPPFFNKEGLKSFFVGHPIVESKVATIFNTKEENLNKLSSNESLISNDNKKLEVSKDILLLLPGSRVKEISILLPIFLKTADLIKNIYKNLHIVIITIPVVKDLVKEISSNFDNNIEIVTSEEQKYQSFLNAKLALAASGTVTLELALAKIKTVVAYKLNILTSIIIKMLIKIKFVTLVNIIANKEIFPEILGPKCNVKNLEKASLNMLKKNLDINTINNILFQLGYNNFIPSCKAADLTINILEGKL